MKHKAPSQYPVVSIQSIRRAMWRAARFGFAIGAGVVGLSWIIFHFITERSK